MRTKLVTLLLAGGLAVTGSTAGVIAAGTPSEGKNAATSQYNDGKCNSGRGNGSEMNGETRLPIGETGPPTVDCDPGNSGGKNQGGD